MRWLPWGVVALYVFLFGQHFWVSRREERELRALAARLKASCDRLDRLPAPPAVPVFDHAESDPFPEDER